MSILVNGFARHLAVAVVVSLVAALLPAVTARGDTGKWPAEPAGAYMTTIIEQKLANEYDVAWQSLYPPHQRAATLAAYVECESRTGQAGTSLGVKVLRVFDERIRVAGEPRRIRTRAVRVRVAVASPLFPAFPVTVVQTFHALAVAGQWKWILSRDQYAYYRAGDCPYA
jgi:hypothetical protein